MGAKANVPVQEIKREDVVLVPDKNFNPSHVCIVTGAANHLGRAMAVAAATNNLMTIGLDADPEEGEKTQYIAREMGGQMIFIETDLSRDEDIDYAVTEASKLGVIKYVANNIRIRDENVPETPPIEPYVLAQEITLRAPLYLMNLAVPHMRKNGNGRGVIGNMITIPSPGGSVNKPIDYILSMVFVALSQSIEIQGDGKIRSFSLHTDCRKSNTTKGEYASRIINNNMQSEQKEEVITGEEYDPHDAISPIEAANLLIFGFSRFGTYLKRAVYPFSTEYKPNPSGWENHVVH